MERHKMKGCSDVFVAQELQNTIPAIRTIDQECKEMIVGICIGRNCRQRQAVSRLHLVQGIKVSTPYGLPQGFDL
jgi:hypothetical protein